MRASWNRLADEHRLRASDAERDAAIGQLRDRFAEGMLSQDTFLYRMDAALRARDRADLSGLLADLPDPGRRRGLVQWFGALLTRAGRTVSGRQGTGGNEGRLAVIRPAAPALPPLWLPPAGDGRFTIGRALACDFTLADLSVSRWHARLYRKDDTWLLSDLGSTNGTRLNGWRVTTGVPVRPGDQVSFGSVGFVIADRSATSDPAIRDRPA